jgi:hypothetical protein
MTLYHVHIYREMRLKFQRIEAENPEAAAAIARDKLTSDADDIDDCDGETFAALVDVVGDEHYEQSKTIDFEPELLRKAAAALLHVCERLARQLPELDDDDTPLAGGDAVDVLAQVWPDLKAAIAKATTGNELAASHHEILDALERVIDYAENEAFSLESHKDSTECEEEAERAWKAVKHARAVIASAKRRPL